LDIPSTQEISMLIKEPETKAEIDSMWQLNHRIFAEEFPQHPPHADGRLVDKFHAKNLYRIAWDGERTVGMICAHWQPPFSAVMKFGSWLSSRLPEGKTAEIRLFALLPEYRCGPLAIALAASMLVELEKRGLQTLVISGISVQQKFYRHIGFQVAGEPVNENGVIFFPMTGDLSAILKTNPTWQKYQRRAGQSTWFISHKK